MDAMSLVDDMRTDLTNARIALNASRKKAEHLDAALREATTFTVNLDAEPHEWITVELTCVAGGGPHKPPHDTWAVRGPVRRCLNADGEWEYEPQPSSRDDAFFARTRWTREEALVRARGVLEKGDT